MSTMSEQTDDYRYYVVYTANHPDGFVRGAIDITRADPVTDYAQVRAIADLIAEKKADLSNVLVMSWRRYEQPPATSDAASPPTAP